MSRALEAERVTVQFGGLIAVNDVSLAVDEGSIVGIIGPNGAGKSTLLDVLAGRQRPDSGSVEWGETVVLGYYDQESRGLVDELRVIDFIEQKAPVIITKDGERVSAFKMLEWFLFPRPQQWARIGSLSGGERRRLYMLYTLIHQPNVLLLDEPTNDLDIQTLTVLEEFLDHFAGSLVVVSHDRYFLDRTVDFLVSFEEGQVSARYPAPFAVYRRLRQEAQQEGGRAKSPAVKAEAPAKSDRPRPRRLTYNEQRELAGLEARIEALEARKAGLQDDINRSGSDYTRLQALADELQAVEAELEACLERWLELAEIGEGD